MPGFDYDSLGFGAVRGFWSMCPKESRGTAEAPGDLPGGVPDRAIAGRCGGVRCLRWDQVPIWLWVKAVLGSHFGVGAPPIIVCFSGDWDVHWGYGLLTHGHVCVFLVFGAVFFDQLNARPKANEPAVPTPAVGSLSMICSRVFCAS